MSDARVTVLYKWTAKPGKLDELVSTYEAVAQQMQSNEEGAEGVRCYVSNGENALYVRDEFQDANAVGFHLTQTAAQHFQGLLQIATPGPFLFFGDVPQELQQATGQMGLGAEFGGLQFGFDR